jgi:2-polyprenyl-3-methyl-5-hydroxy-6-metoxy-1,4-benzoquinol methylase
MFTFVRRCAERILLIILDVLSTTHFVDFIEETVTRRANTLPPDQALRFLFRLDSRLYTLVGIKAVDYGNGLHTKHWHTRYHDFFVTRVHADERVLDIGCGNGAVAYDLVTRAGAKVVGIDRSIENITQAQNHYKHPRLSFIVGDALHDLFGSHFDVVVLSNILEHLKARPDFLRLVQEKVDPYRILIRVPLYERDWRVPLKKELGVEWRLDPTHEIEYTLESFTKEAKEAGLKIIHQEVR